MSSKDELQIIKNDLKDAIKKIDEIHDYIFTRLPKGDGLEKEEVKKVEKKK